MPFVLDGFTRETGVGGAPINAAYFVASANAVLTNEQALTATQTELNYVHDVTSAIQTQINAKVGTGTTVNGHALSGNVTVSATDVGLGNVANIATQDVPHGGSGLTSLSAYGVMCAGANATANMVQVTGVGTAGQVLTSNDAGAAPSWQNAAGSPPWHVVIPAYQPAVSNTNWDVVDGSSDSIRNDGSLNSERKYQVTLAAGTWNFTVVHSRDTSRGIISLYLDDVDTGKTLDMYGSSQAYDSVAATGITVATTGLHTFICKMLTKNAGSAWYYAVPHFFLWDRTA